MACGLTGVSDVDALIASYLSREAACIVGHTIADVDSRGTFWGSMGAIKQPVPFC